MEPENKPPKRPIPSVIFNKKELKAQQCIHQLLGDTIDIKWDLDKATLEVSSSKQEKMRHRIEGREQFFTGVPFRHSHQCPLLEPHLEPNPSATVRPCAVVLIQNKNTKKILATQRHQHMSFGNKWVLPGGHLQQGEPTLLGGLRQCEEQVGLKHEKVTLNEDKMDLMVWESVLVDEKAFKIKRAALVFFFRVETEDFEVSPQASQVKAWEWRQFEKDGSPWGDGWALGHLRYLAHVWK